MRRYAPAIATQNQLDFLQARKKARNRWFDGTTWLMNHWRRGKHPDHFNMKVLEFRALMTNKKSINSSYYFYLPTRVDRLVSMDYTTAKLTPYEQFIKEIVEDSLQQRLIMSSLNLGMKQYFVKNQLIAPKYLFSYCRIFQNQSSFIYQHHSLQEYCLSNNNNKTFFKAPFWYAEKVYLSPRYKNNIPYPEELSQSSFLMSAKNVILKQLNLSTAAIPCTKPPGTETKPIVAILHRTDGIGLRRILNSEEVSQVTKSILSVRSVQNWYISGNMTPIAQAIHFHCFDVLISSHSSQLTNLIFSRKGSSVIEIQPEIAKENTFYQLGMQAGLNYFFLNKGHVFRKGDSENWKLWDIYVNLTLLSDALNIIKQSLVLP